jgi:hypothetical protein
LLEPYLKVSAQLFELGMVMELQALNCTGSQKANSGPYLDPGEYNSHPNPLKFHLNVILPSLPSSFGQVHTSHLFHMSQPPHPSIDDANIW